MKQNNVLAYKKKYESRFYTDKIEKAVGAGEKILDTFIRMGMSVKLHVRTEFACFSFLLFELMNFFQEGRNQVKLTNVLLYLSMTNLSAACQKAFSNCFDVVLIIVR